MLAIIVYDKTDVRHRNLSPLLRGHTLVVLFYNGVLREDNYLYRKLAINVFVAFTQYTLSLNICLHETSTTFYQTTLSYRFNVIVIITSCAKENS